MIKRRTQRANPVPDLDPVLRLWLLRILVPLAAQRELVRSHGFGSDTIATTVDGKATTSGAFDLAFRMARVMIAQGPLMVFRNIRHR